MEFLRPDSADAVLEILASRGTEAAIVAGGTCVMRDLQRGAAAKPDLLLDLGGIRRELSGIETGADRLVIGALTPVEDVLESPAVRASCPALGEAAAQFGSWQIRSVATLGGSVCSAAPAADLLAPLLLHDTTLTFAGAGGRRREVGLDRFLAAAPGEGRAADELLVSIALRPPGPDGRERYLKVGRREAMEVAIAGLAARLVFDPAGERVLDARIAVTGVSSFPRRAPEVEEALTGGPAPAQMPAAREAIAACVDCADDVHASAGYRRRLLPRMLARLVSEIRLADRGSS